MGPWGPWAPVEVMVMSRVAGWAVSSFSLLSSRRLAGREEREGAKWVAGVVIQPCTSAVTSSVMYWPAVEAVNMPAVAPSEGAVAEVTADSDQAEVAGARVTRPMPLTRLTK